MSRDTVTLHPAHTWTCPGCGAVNFEPCVIVEHSEEGREELEDLDLPTVTGFWVTAPEEVECQGCGTTFDAVDERE
jgi:ribosomal protein S27E